MSLSSRLLSVLAVGVLLAGCAGDVAGVTPGGPAEAVLGAWAAPGSYQYEGEVTWAKFMGAGAGYGIGFSYFFEPVQDSDKPYALQAFYQRPGYVKVGDIDLENAGDAWFVEGSYTLPAMDGKLTLNAGVGPNVIFISSTDVDFSIGAGYRIMDDLEVTLDFAMEDGDTNDIIIGGQYILPVAGTSLDLSLDLDLKKLFGASGLVINFGADYYLMKELSVGLILETWGGDFTSAFNVGAQAAYYTGPLTVSLSYLLNENMPNFISTAVGFRF